MWLEIIKKLSKVVGKKVAPKRATSSHESRGMEIINDFFTMEFGIFVDHISCAWYAG